MGGYCGVGRRPKPGICPLGGSGTFGEEKMRKTPLRKKKNDISFPSWLQ